MPPIKSTRLHSLPIERLMPMSAMADAGADRSCERSGPLMPFMDGHTLLTLLIAASGAGMFLRVVAKEKRRRDKHLELRLQEKAKQLEAEANLQPQEVAEAGPESADDTPVLTPADGSPPADAKDAA